MALSLEKYSTSAFNFPSDEINPAKKDEKWALQYLQALYAKWKKGQTAIPYSQVEEIISLRQLAAGKQNILQYQKILMDEADAQGAVTGYMNINWDVFNVMPKFLRVVLGMMEQQDHQVVATAVDPSSTEEREEAKLQMAFKMRFKNQLREIEKSLGITNESEFVPDSMEELNIYEGAGGFKLAKEIEIEQGLDYSFYISSWKEIKKKLIYDACVINCLATKDYTDQYTKKVKARYVDPQFFVGEFDKSDQRKLINGGEIIQVSIYDLRKLLNIPEHELLLLAQDYNGINGNANLTAFDYYEETRTSTYDSLLVDVMDAEWKSVNSEYYTSRKNKYDNNITYKEEWGKVYDTEKKKTSKYDIHVVFRGKWIIGSDYVYDFGLQYDIPRPGKKEVELSYHFYRLPGRSLVSLSESHLHQMALAFYKIQNGIATSRPSGLAIEIGALENISFGKKKLAPLELIKIVTQTGYLLYRATTHKGQPNVPGGWKPIQELQGGMGTLLDEQLKIIDFNINAVRELTGINQVADASNPNPEQSIGGSQIALAATNNALRPIYSAYIFIKEQTAKNLSMRMQILIKHNKEAYEGYMPVIGQLGVQIISVGADAVDADYFIKYEAKPTEKRRDTILQAAISAMQPDKDGVASIRYSDYLMIERMLESGSLKFAEAYLNYKSQKMEEKRLQLQRENMALDSQREQALVAAKTQAAEKESQIKIQTDLAIYEGKKKIDEQYAQLQHKRDMEKLGVQSSLGIVQDAAKNNAAAVPA